IAPAIGCEQRPLVDGRGDSQRLYDDEQQPEKPEGDGDAREGVAARVKAMPQGEPVDRQYEWIADEEQRLTPGRQQPLAQRPLENQQQVENQDERGHLPPRAFGRIGAWCAPARGWTRRGEQHVNGSRLLGHESWAGVCWRSMPVLALKHCREMLQGS